MILLRFVLSLVLLINTTNCSFLKGCNYGGSCVDEKWRNDTHWNIICMEWMELDEGDIVTCPKPWKCCHTTQYEKKIPYPKH
ncbi:uncharacterized protein LOC117141440 [Drosophila mauritiana]|uniref:Uncharacterized protein LOC117141440 n=1 Tax=Drosophila mauritiana TaxID=7226 RepID=A0A6P8K984_DROMA|nr:uncharacterized protein LOC117141440 [Drosophila mauritiana]